MSKGRERDADQGLPEELPASVVHQLPEEEGQLDRVQFSREKVFDFIRRVEERPAYFASQFELDLEKGGLLSGLEEAGVLPLGADPNKSETSAGTGHQEPAERAREKALKDLYVGTMLGHLFDELFSNK